MSESKIRPIVTRSVSLTNEDMSANEIHPVLRRIYNARGVITEEELDYSLRKILPVSTLTGVNDAVQLVLKHKNKRIIIIGDFDADGATSTALVLRCLREFGIEKVDYLVPNRFQFGYGLTPEIVRVAAERSPDLLITVDNGVSSVAGVEEAHKLGMKVLITDHHLPGKELPKADASVNPNLVGSHFGSPHLAGVGVAFYLMAAVGRALETSGTVGASRIPARYLDLVALGTVADVVRLDYNNRIIVHQGLKRIRSGKAIPGIGALLRIGSKSISRAISTDLAFAVGPRLNAAGRLEDMSVGIECLLTDDAQVADQIALVLDEINRKRRTIEVKMRNEAFDYVNAMEVGDVPPCVCLYNENWHQGIVGLIASRVRERCDRPVIAFAREGTGLLKGSARSIPGIHVRDLLEAVSTAVPGLIEKFGGHAMAAGLSLPEVNFDRFATVVSECLSRLYPDADFSGAILTDGSLSPASMNLDFATILREGGPWGAGFPEPVFCGDFKVVEQRTVGEHHLKLRVTPLRGEEVIDAIAFNQAGPVFRGNVQLVYRLDVNEYRGIESPQLVVEQIVNLNARA